MDQLLLSDTDSLNTTKAVQQDSCRVKGIRKSVCAHSAPWCSCFFCIFFHFLSISVRVFNNLYQLASDAGSH